MPTITISEVTFDISSPYKEGHQLTLIEAEALNGLRHENIRNAFRPKVISYEKGEKTLESLKEEFAAYDRDYVFKARSTRAAPASLLEQETKKIASELVKTIIRKKNLTLSQEEFDLKVKTYIAEHPEVEEEAARRAEATKNLALALFLEG
jgi:hypothetical protein